MTCQITAQDNFEVLNERLSERGGGFCVELIHTFDQLESYRGDAESLSRRHGRPLKQENAREQLSKNFSNRRITGGRGRIEKSKKRRMSADELNGCINKLGDELLNTQRCGLTFQGFPGGLKFPSVLSAESLGEGFLIRKKLIKRTNARASTAGDFVHSRGFIADIGDHGRGSIEQRSDPALTTLLARHTTRRGGRM